MTFELRSDGIAHYRETHAKNSIRCPICLKTVSCPKINIFLKHCRNWHPHAKIPFDFDKTKRRSIAQEFQVDQVSY